MAKQVTNTSQLSTYSLVKAALKANATIAARFKDSDFYEYEPLLKALNVNIPYIVIKVPQTEPVVRTINHAETMKSFTATIIMVNDWEARSNVLSYANAVIKAIESYESTFESSGYFDVECMLESSDPEIISEKQVVSTIFTITWNGQVSR